MRPRLTIVVPYCRDEAAFETTLVSVLENRPQACEVLVPHDGSYSDPFSLSDEVRFIIPESDNSIIGLLDAATQRARGSILHVIAEGVRAVEGWTAPALEQFEGTNVGAVAPVVMDIGNPKRIVAAGWATDRQRIYRPLGFGNASLKRIELQTVTAPYLSASFWRRDCLAACLEAGIGHPMQAAQLAIGYALSACDMECRIATECFMFGGEASFVAPRDTQAARDAQAIRMGALGQGRFGALTETLLGCVTGALSTSNWSRSAGRLLASLSGKQQALLAQQQIQSARDLWQELDTPTRCVIPVASHAVPLRRAA